MKPLTAFLLLSLLAGCVDPCKNEKDYYFEKGYAAGFEQGLVDATLADCTNWEPCWEKVKRLLNERKFTKPEVTP